MSVFNGRVWSGTPDPLALPPAVRFSQLTGFYPRYLWLGNSATDRVRGEVLTPVSGAVVNQATDKLHVDTSLYGGGQYAFTAASMSALDAADATVADVTTRLLVLHVFRSTVKPAVGNESLYGKRGGALANGYEMVVSTGGVPIATADVGTSSGTAQLTTDHLDGFWHVLGFAVEGSLSAPGTIKIASESHPVVSQVQPAGSLTNAGIFAIGQQRINAADADVALTAVCTDFALSASKTLQDVCQAVADERFWIIEKAWL